MFKVIDAASLVRYNANVRGNNVGDCVCRSISFAFDLPYSQVGKLLNAKMKEVHRKDWRYSDVYGEVIADLGGSSKLGTTIDNETGEVLRHGYPTVEEFADENPKGCYLITCGKNPNDSKTSHLVCIVDNKIYDSWDCLNYYAKTFYDCSNINRHVESEDIIDNMEDYIQYAVDIIESEIDRLAKKWIVSQEDANIQWVFDIENAAYNGYTILLNYYFEYSISGYSDKDQGELRFKINCALKPGMTDQQAKDFILKTVKQRSYDRMYVVRETIKKDIESFHAAHEEGAETADQRYMYIGPAEERFIKQLPGKVKRYIQSIEIYKPGQYYDSYRVTLRRLPGDTGPSTVDFQSYEAAGCRKMIERYVKTFERPWDDYDPEMEGYI